MLITKRSMISGKTHTMDIDVTPEQMVEFTSPGRRMIQEIFPDLTADEREFIKTGITPTEWAVTFPPEREDDAN